MAKRAAISTWPMHLRGGADAGALRDDAGIAAREDEDGDGQRHGPGDGGGERLERPPRQLPVGPGIVAVEIFGRRQRQRRLAAEGAARAPWEGRRRDRRRPPPRAAALPRSAPERRQAIAEAEAGSRRARHRIKAFRHVKAAAHRPKSPRMRATVRASPSSSGWGRGSGAADRPATARGRSRRAGGAPRAGRARSAAGHD